ncbi:MAG TPA: DUF1592 domain-containing protein [Polyangiaceae bacterium]|nr:DUF1592 domain-containing protein [Polyangiaceae bacterium]
MSLLLCVACNTSSLDSAQPAEPAADVGNQEPSVGEPGAGGSPAVGDPGAMSPTEVDACVTANPGAAPIRRMTHFEYNATVRDLLGDATRPADSFGMEEEALGFNNNAANLVTSATLAEKYMVAAEAIAARATESLATLLPCDPLLAGERACAEQFIQSFGQRAFRRPLAPEEVTLFLEQFDAGLADGDFTAGIQMVIETALQSPAFLYRVEFGAVPATGETAVRLSSWETASRLSYLLWGSMPDEQLFAAAAAAELSTAEQIAAQARRLLDDPKAREAVANFHQQWLDYNRIANVSKDATLFPEWTTSIAGLMREEARAFLDDAVFGSNGSLASLLTSSNGFLNADLATFYGVTGPVGTTFEPVALDPTQRAGVLTLGSLLSINAHSNQTSPVHRGLLVRERFLCDPVPPPPPDVMVQAPAPNPDSTARERFAEHSVNPACGGCHSLMDPLGFGFENYDAMGRYRTEENGLPIDATGSIIASDVDGPYVGVIELAGKLAASQEVENCYVKQWFRYGYGRGETATDSCSLATLSDRFNAAQGNIKELLVALTQTDAFLYRPVSTGAGGTP